MRASARRTIERQQGAWCDEGVVWFRETRYPRGSSTILLDRGQADDTVQFTRGTPPRIPLRRRADLVWKLRWIIDASCRTLGEISLAFVTNATRQHAEEIVEDCSFFFWDVDSRSVCDFLFREWLFGNVHEGSTGSRAEGV